MAATLLPDSAEPATGDTPPGASLAGAQVRDDGAIVHRVVAGETPLGIAFLYDLPLEELYALNGLAPGALLQIDQELIIGQQPTPTTVLPTATATGGPTEAPTVTLTEEPVATAIRPTATTIATAAARSAAVAQVEPEPTTTAAPDATDREAPSSGALLWLAVGAAIVVLLAAAVILRLRTQGR